LTYWDDSGFRGTDEGDKLKETGTGHWTGATNESGFSALPGGYRHYYGSYYDMCDLTYFWSSDVWLRGLFNHSGIYRTYSGNKDYGCSVRCVRD